MKEVVGERKNRVDELEVGVKDLRISHEDLRISHEDLKISYEVLKISYEDLATRTEKLETKPKKLMFQCDPESNVSENGSSYSSVSGISQYVPDKITLCDRASTDKQGINEAEAKVLAKNIRLALPVLQKHIMTIKRGGNQQKEARMIVTCSGNINEVLEGLKQEMGTWCLPKWREAVQVNCEVDPRIRKIYREAHTVKEFLAMMLGRQEVRDRFNARIMTARCYFERLLNGFVAAVVKLTYKDSDEPKISEIPFASYRGGWEAHRQAYNLVLGPEAHKQAGEMLRNVANSQAGGFQFMIGGVM